MEGKWGVFKVGDLPTVMYIPEFIQQDEETHLRNKIYEAPPSKWKTLKNRRLQNWGGVVHEKGLLPQELPFWLTKITQRICEESGLFPSAINHVLINEYLPNQGIMLHQDGPAYFPVVAILSLGSHVVMDFTPHSRLRTCTGTQQNNAESKSDGDCLETVVDHWVDSHHPFSVLLMPRSLLIFKDNAYSDYLHGIQDSEVQQYDKVTNEAEAWKHNACDQPTTGLDKPVEAVRSEGLKVIHRSATRISLTCRLVLKVHRNLFKF